MPNLPRRDFLKLLAATSLAGTLPSEGQALMTNSLPSLPYAYSALEPWIDSATMQIHYEKHHAAYLKGLNQALSQHPGPWSGWSVDQMLASWEELPTALQLPVKNFGGGHWNHSFFWKILAPAGSGNIPGDLRGELEDTFDSVSNFQARFQEAALSRFGSGWVWLVVDRGGGLTVRSTANQDCPLLEQEFPLLGLDLWEHAYYLKYQNRRKDYVEAFWNVVRWEEVGSRFRSLSRI